MHKYCIYLYIVCGFHRDCDTMAANLKSALEEGEPLRKVSLYITLEFGMFMRIAYLCTRQKEKQEIWKS